MSKANGDAEKLETVDGEDAKPGLLGRRRTLLIAIMLGVNVFVGGIISVLLLGRKPAPEPVADVVTPVDVPASIAKGDELLLTGHGREAIKYYEMAAAASSPVPPSLTYRIGLWAEQTGDLDQALDAFKMISHEPDRELAFAARLGQALVHFQKQEFAQAIQILSPAARISAQPAYGQSNVGGHIGYVLALAMAAEVGKQVPGSVYSDSHVFAARVDFEVDQLLSLVQQRQQQQRNTGAGSRTFGEDSRFGIEVHAGVAAPETTLASAGIEQKSIAEILDVVAIASGWKIQLSNVAREIALAKRIDVFLNDKTLAEILSLVLEPQQLFWSFDGDTISIDRFETVPRSEILTRHAARANHLLEIALSDTPSHHLASQARLALGNLASQAGRTDRASAFYREIRDRYPGKAMTQTASFNLAKVLYANGEMDAAIQTFYEVIDQRKGSKLEPLSYLYVGRIHLDRGEARQSKKVFSRGLALAKQPDVIATASLSLASAYLLAEDGGSAAAANAVLMEGRGTISVEPFRNQAVFLSALTRFRAAISRKELNRLGDELLSAASRVDASSFFGNYGYLLVGDAFADLNITSETVRLYREGLQKTVGTPMHPKLMFRLATEYQRQAELALAKDTLLELAAMQSEEWSPKAIIQVAELLLEMNEYADCRLHCRWALRQKFAQEHSVELLRILGRVYEEFGDHKSAGLCYAGFLPQESRVAEVQR